jgi:NADPH2:quinone reductase
MATVEAVRVHKWLKGPEELQIDRIPAPDPPGDGEYEIDVRAIGCNFYDVLQIQGKYQFKPPFPFIPGNEFSGVVARRGPGADRFEVGDRVFGSQQGAYTERVVCDGAVLMPVPASLSFAQAAGISVTYPTSHYALTRRGRVRPVF